MTITSILQGDDEPLTSALEAFSVDAPSELVARLEPVPDAVDPETLEPANDVVETLWTALYYGLSTEIKNTGRGSQRTRWVTDTDDEDCQAPAEVFREWIDPRPPDRQCYRNPHPSVSCLHKNGNYSLSPSAETVLF